MGADGFYTMHQTQPVKVQRKPGKVKIFCGCGVEIWQNLDAYARNNMSIQVIEEAAICSDCALEEAQSGRTEKFNRDQEARHLVELGTMRQEGFFDAWPEDQDERE